MNTFSATKFHDAIVGKIAAIPGFSTKLTPSDWVYVKGLWEAGKSVEEITDLLLKKRIDAFAQKLELAK